MDAFITILLWTVVRQSHGRYPGPRITDPSAPSSLTVAAALAALSISIRPTMLVFWSYLHLEQTVAQLRSKGVPAVFDLWLRTLIAG